MPEQLIRRLKSLGPFYFFGNPGNLGDLLIAEATRQFFRRHDIPYVEYDPSKLPDEYNLVYGGGGRFVSYWADKEKSSELDASVAFDIAVVWGTTGRETAYSAELLRQYMKALSQVDVVVSDRLHVCIMARICGLEVYMLDNIYGKLSGVYDVALKDSAECHLLRDGVLPADLEEAWERFSAAMRRRQKRSLRRRRRKEMMKRWGARFKEMGRAIRRNLFRS